MAQATPRRVLVMALGLIAMAAGVVSLLAVGRLFDKVTSRSETADIFNDAAALSPDLLTAVRWGPDPDDLSRPMEPLTRDDITRAWLRAWPQLAIVAETGDTSGVDIYFSSSARAALLESVDDLSGAEIRQISHDLTLSFYSEDGVVVGIRADEVRLLRQLPMPGNDLRAYFDTVESYEAVLLLEDGNWRVQHWVRRDVEGDWWSTPFEPALDEPAVAPAVDYLPTSGLPADLLDPAYEDQAARDFVGLAARGVEAVRLPLDYSALGGADVDPAALAQTERLLDRADEAGLEVTAVLFAGMAEPAGQDVGQWDANDRHIESVVTALAEHPALAMWDLKDAPDVGIEWRGQGSGGAGTEAEGVMHAWLAHVGRSVRTLDAATPITVRWSNAQAAVRAPVIVDVISFTFVGSEADVAASLAAVEGVAGTRPVLMSRPDADGGAG